ncbi:MAG: hypothetical protein KC978_11805 [Candidatus Omnitrophica bacterium]|nr:hypothetical protein [Candidatus Omnitrophota bacterium]
MNPRSCIFFFSLFVTVFFYGFSVAHASEETAGLVPPVSEGSIKGLPEGPLEPVPKFDPIQPTQKEYDCFVLINAARANPAAYGYGEYSPAPPLHWNAALLYIAWVHSKDMYEEDYFQHDSYNRVGDQLVFDRSWSDRVRSVYTHNTRISENIAWNSSGSAEAVVTSWMNSPPHRENIMNPEHTEGAIGAYGGNDKVYFTHDFGGRDISYNLSLDPDDVSLSPTQPNPGDTVRLSFIVWNNGVTDAFPVEVRIDKREGGGGWSAITGDLWLRNILEGGKGVSTYTDLDTSGYSRGTEVRVVIDPNGLFTETDESDNSAGIVLIPAGSTSRGDLTADGVVDGMDLFRFAAGWQTLDWTCNLDTGGYVNCQDLVLLLKEMD